MTPERPFYGSFAWAYDHLVDRPIAEEGFAVAGMLAEAGVRAPANVLDAGCGTGRHAAVLTALGYRVDVRDWDATVRTKTAQPVHERTVDTGRGRLTFRSETRLDAVTRRLLISERHALTAGGRATTETYEFVMRCWTPDELRDRLSDAGFEIVQLRPGYTEPAARPDRLVVIARRRSG